MAPQRLTPDSSLLSEEYVLVQAWKKAHEYIRRHNWYSDVLELDMTNADLERRLGAVAADVQSSEGLRPEPLRLVLAPKKQQWDLKNGKWAPVDGPSSVEKRLRPLAHLSARDQILGTAFMMLLADTVETRQHDPRVSVPEARRLGMMSYGHRLLCDEEDGHLHFRWGNSVVYRQYFQDYEAFISRPQQVVDAEFPNSTDWAIAYADLSQFYDRVRPAELFGKIRQLVGNDADPVFLHKFRSFFDWNWFSADKDEAFKYSQNASPAIDEYEHVALPQGLVASGFFSNALLIDFDEAIWAGINQWHDNNGWQLVDYCRYVDDMRIVLRLGAGLRNATESDIAKLVSDHLIRILNETAECLVLNPEKTEVILGRDAAAGSIPVSETMKRINHNTSGTIDPFLGEETIDLIEGLFFSRQEELLEFEDRFRDTFFTAKPDVRHETVDRFAANRFRRTFRALRPLCEDAPESSSPTLLPALSRESLDNKAAYFCRRLIERWVRDPSNMRLLRVAMDVYPHDKNLDVVLDLLKQYVDVGKKRKSPRRVAWYCAAELLKAGATETGLVADDDLLPAGIDLKRYQEKLAEFAKQIAERPQTYPWFLVQQAYLFLACMGKYSERRIHPSTSRYLKDHLRLHHTLAGRTNTLRREDIVPFVLLREHMHDADSAAQTFLACVRDFTPAVQRKLLLRVLQENVQLADAIRMKMEVGDQEAWAHLFDVHGIPPAGGFPDSVDELPTTPASYPFLSIARSVINPFQQEYASLHFARGLLHQLPHEDGVLFPSRINLHSCNWRALCSDQFPIAADAVSVQIEATTEYDGRFAIPSWISPDDQWRYQLGQILRVLLTGLPDYTQSVWRPRPERSHVLYTPYRSSWLRRRYAVFNGRNAFGPDWLPISSWLGSLLCRLLEWPGFARFDFDFGLPDEFSENDLSQLIDSRIAQLERLYGRASFTPVLAVRIPKTFMHPHRVNEPDDSASLYRMHVGVVQTVIPRQSAFASDPQLDQPPMRFRHRRHLSAVLGGVHRMLQVRDTHRGDASNIELLVFPELSVHPADVKTHLIPFALQHRCIIFAGLVFHPASPTFSQLINSGCWIIPVRNLRGSLQVYYVEQGKSNLTPPEQRLGITPFRPAQWILEFVHPTTAKKLWSLTGAICYDATDIRLAADLRNLTDMFIIPALNTDVGTFDNMAAALHYHMFQHVIVSNTGEFGGSTGQAPFENRHKRILFHTHGNEQASISFFEIDLNTYRNTNPPLKTPPAGYQPRS